MNFDLFYNKLIGKKLNLSNDNINWKKEKNISKNEEVWICFLGWRTSIKTAKILNLLPKNYIVYQLPPALVNANPHQTIKLFNEIYKDIKKELNYLDKINIFSISLGNIFGFYLTQRFKINKFISLLPGPELGKNIFSSPMSKTIKKKAQKERYNQKKYDEILKEYNCINNISKLPENTLIFISDKDKYIPSKDQKELILEIKKINNNINVKEVNLGHVFTHIYFGIRNSLNKIEW